MDTEKITSVGDILDKLENLRAELLALETEIENSENRKKITEESSNISEDDNMSNLFDISFDEVLKSGSKIPELPQPGIEQKKIIEDVLKTDAAFIALFTLGKDFLYLKKWDIAVEVFKRCIIYKPNDINLLIHTGYAMSCHAEKIRDEEERRKCLEEAKEILLRAHEIDNDNKSVLSNLGCVNIDIANLIKNEEEKLSLLKEAEGCARDAFSEDDPVSSNNLAEILSSIGEMEKDTQKKEEYLLSLRSHYEKSTEKPHEHSRIWVNFAWYLINLSNIQKDLTKKKELLLEAESKCKHAISMPDFESKAWETWANILFLMAELKDDTAEKKKLLEEAISKCGSATRMKDHDDSVWILWSCLLRSKATLEEDNRNKVRLLNEAMMKCQKTKEIDSLNHCGQGNIYLDMADLEEDLSQKRELLQEACKAFEQSVNCDEKNEISWNAWGYTLSDLISLGNDEDEMIRFCDESLEKHERALAVDMNYLLALNNCIWTKIRKSELVNEEKQKIELLEEAGEKLMKAVELQNRENNVEVFCSTLSYWAWKLICEGELAESPESAEKLFLEAIDKCKEALERKSDLVGAFKNWASALNHLSELTEEESKKNAFLKEAITKCEDGEKFLKEHCSSGGRFYYEWGQALEKLACISRDHFTRGSFKDQAREKFSQSEKLRII